MKTTVKDITWKSCLYKPGQDYHQEWVGDTLYVYFHPSVSFQDWLRVFLFNSVSFLGFRCHNGFFKEFRETMFMLPIHCKNLVCVGYSRGAAVALLYYLYYKTTEKGLNVKAVILGAPRVFTKLNKYFEFSDITEVVYGKDIVRNLLFWYKKNPSTSIVHIPSESKGLFKSFSDHTGYFSSSVEIDI